MTQENFTREEVVENMRKAIGDRATWFYLLNKEVENNGMDAEKIARSAVFKFGCMKGEKLDRAEDVKSFIEGFVSDISKGIFEMELKENNYEQAVLEFNYCPLVESWKKLGCAEEELDTLCDWAMEGDRGIMENFPALKMDIQSRIGAGDKCCRLVFTKKLD